MAVSRKDCIASAKAAGATDVEAAQIVDQLMEEKARLAAGGQLDRAAQGLSELWTQKVEDMQRKALLQRRHAALDVLRRREIDTFIENVKAQGFSVMDALEALLVGNAKWFEGARASVSAERKAIRQLWEGPMLNELERLGEGDGVALKLMREDKAFHDNVIREIVSPGSTADDVARQAADIFSRYMEQARLRLNAAGADIGRLEGWVPQAHDPWKLTRGGMAGKDAWMDFVAQRLDVERSFPDAAGNPERLRDILGRVYDSITTGHNGDVTPAERGHGTGPRNLTSGLGQHRVLHFLDADAAIEYANTYGHGNLIDAMFRHLDLASRKTALMERLGPNPQAMLESVIAQQKRLLAEDAALPPDLRQRQINDLDAAMTGGIIKGGKIAHWLAELTGETSWPANPTAARAMAFLRFLQSVSKLGGASLSAVADVFVKACAMRVNGVSWPEGMSRSLQQYIHRYKGEEREVARQLGTFIDYILGDMHARWDLTDDLQGRLGDIQNKFFKWSGLNWITEQGKAGYAMWISGHLGEVSGKSFDQLDKTRRAMLRYHGINAEKWDVIRHMTQTLEDGRTLLVPTRAQDLPDAALERLLPEELRDYEYHLTQEREWRTERRRLRGKRKRAWDEARAAFREEKNAYRVALQEWRKERAQALRTEKRRAYRDWKTSQESADAAWRKSKDRYREELKEWRTERAKTLRAKRRKAYREWYARPEIPRPAQADILNALPENLRTPPQEPTRITIPKPTVSEIQGRLPEHLQSPPPSPGRPRAPQWTEAQKIPQDPQIPTREQWERRRARELTRLRNRLQTESLSMISDETGFAIVEPDDKARATMRQGTRPGTFAGEAWRTVMQFKSFPISYMQRILAGRRWVRGDLQEGMRYGWNRGSIGDALTRDMGGLVGFTLNALAFGYASMVLKDLSKGRSPREWDKWETWLAAAMQSGGAGIYGDFFLAKANRFGNDLAGTLAGPLLGTAGDVAKIPGMLLRGEGRDALEQSIRTTLDNAPFINLWYTRAALDWTLLYHVREWMSPGTLARTERKMKETYGQDMFVSPARNIKRGGGLRQPVMGVGWW